MIGFLRVVQTLINVRPYFKAILHQVRGWDGNETLYIALSGSSVIR